MSDTPKVPTPTERIQRALNTPGIPRLYFNGFANAVGTADVIIVLEQNGQPAAVLNASYAVAKTFSARIADLIRELEQDTGNTIMTTEDVGRTLKRREAL